MDRAVIGPREDSKSKPRNGPRLPSFRVRTLMAVVGLVALLISGGMAGTRSYDFSRRAREFATEGRHWGEIAVRRKTSDPKMASFASECADYYQSLSQKYDRASRHPLRPVAPDPLPPGVQSALDAANAVARSLPRGS